MRIHWMGSLAAGVVALASPLVFAQTNADTNTNPAAPSGQAGAAGYSVAGVVTKVDKMGHKVSIVAPTGKSTELQQLGQNILVESDVSFQALNGPVAKNTKILRDGKQASFNDLKEGDVVRAAYDPSTQTFSNIRAVSQIEVDSNPNQASVDLKNAGPMGGQKPSQGNAQ